MEANYFVGIGAAKSGTSWLADYLSGHPDVAMSPIKELHYFDARYCPEFCGHWDKEWAAVRDKLKARSLTDQSEELKEKLRCVTLRLEMIQQPQKYKQYFDALVTDSHRAYGEITPSYSLLPVSGFAAIKALYPDAKFVFLMRDPVDRYLSQIKFIQRLRSVQGKQPLAGFDANDKALDLLSNPEYVNRGDYRRTIEALLEVAGEDDVCVLFYEHLFAASSQEHELRKLCEFLSVPFRPADISTRINAGDVLQFDDEVKVAIRTHFASTYDFVEEKYSKRAPESWRWNSA
ncbi:MAG: sulfotransferase [Halioglobus sp.]